MNEYFKMKRQMLLSMIILWCGVHVNKTSATVHIHYQGNDLPNNSYIDLSELTDKQLKETVFQVSLVVVFLMKTTSLNLRKRMKTSQSKSSD